MGLLEVELQKSLYFKCLFCKVIYTSSKYLARVSLQRMVERQLPLIVLADPEDGR